MPEFDPYVEWLEIDPALCPPNFYDLLGITPFESDAQIIEHAFEQRLKHVRSFQTGPRGLYTQDLLNELAQARLCLLSEQDRLAYDDFLRGGRSKPPVVVENLLGDTQSDGAIPPVAADAIQVSDSNSSELRSDTAKTQSQRKLSIVYVSACIVALVVIWGIVKWTQGGSGEQANSNDESQKEVVEKKAPPKKIINTVEEKKGILPGANNSFLLAPQNAAIDQPHPAVIDTTDGQLLDQWQPARSNVRWELWINTPGHYEAIVSYNATTNGKYSRIVVKADEEYPKSVKMRTAEEMNKFFEEEFVILFRERGAHVVNISVEGETGDFRLKSITLRPNRTTRE